MRGTDELRVLGMCVGVCVGRYVRVCCVRACRSR